MCRYVIGRAYVTKWVLEWKKDLAPNDQTEELACLTPVEEVAIAKILPHCQNVCWQIGVNIIISLVGHIFSY